VVEPFEFQNFSGPESDEPSDHLSEFLRHILASTGASAAAIYSFFPENPLMFSLASAHRPEFPAAALEPIAHADPLLPADFFAAGRWIRQPGESWKPQLAHWHLSLLPLRGRPPHRRLLLLVHGEAEAARIADFCDTAASTDAVNDVLTSLIRSRRMSFQQWTEDLFHTLRRQLFTSLSHNAVLNLLAAEYAAWAGLSGIRFFLVKPGRTEWKPVFAAWDSPGITGTDHWHVLFRSLLSGDARFAVLDASADPRVPLGLPVCYLRLDLPPYRCDLLLASDNQKQWKPDRFLSLQVLLENLGTYLDEIALLDNTLQDYALQREVNQLVPRLFAMDDLQIFYRQLPELLRDYLHVESVAVYHRGEDGNRLERFAYSGSAAAQTSPQAVREEDPSTFLGQCAREGRALLKPRLAAREQRRVADHRDFCSLLYYPILVGDKVSAVIKAAETRPDRVNFSHLHRLSVLDTVLAQIMAKNQRYSQLTRRLFYDMETGLLNRRGFEEAIRQHLAGLSGGGRYFSVMMASVDQPDPAILQNPLPTQRPSLAEIQQHLRRQLPPAAVLAYAGESMFFALIPGQDLDQALDVGRKICVRAHETNWQGGGRPTFSVGVSSCPINGLSEDELLLSAEQAMTISRYQGGNIASIMGSQIIKKLAVSIFSGFLGRTDFETGPELVDGVLRRITDGPKPEGRLTTLEMINSLAEAIDAKDPYTRDHTLETSVLAVQLGRRLGLGEQPLERLRSAARLHDIGKIGIPERILRKKGKLTAKEMAVIQKHPEIGAKILHPIQALRDIAHIVEHHHERWDGTGYPHGLTGEAIPVESRILAVIDSFHAMTSHRVYQDNKTAANAMREIERCAGTQFDPQIARMFIQMLGERGGAAESAASAGESPAKSAETYM
jgi:putative nucleotidyltransferase with HDIG domain